MQTQSLIPSFEDEKLQGIDVAFGAALDEIAIVNEDFKTLANPMLCKEKFLPYLAFSYKVDFWNEFLTVEEKRLLIQKSILLHRKKGTIFALEEVFKALDITAIIKEWFTYSGKPYHFMIDLESASKPIDAALYESLEKYVLEYKNVRSVLEKININVKTSAKEFYSTVALYGETVEIYPFKVTLLENEGKENYAMATKISEKITTTLKVEV